VFLPEQMNDKVCSFRKAPTTCRDSMVIGDPHCSLFVIQTFAQAGTPTTAKVIYHLISNPYPEGEGSISFCK